MSQQSFKANSIVEIEGYSRKIQLASLTANNDGSIVANINTKDLPIGRHVITLSGSTISGEPIEYYQFVTVFANNNDHDKDGVKNDDDKCSFIDRWVDEISGVDVCRTNVATNTQEHVDNATEIKRDMEGANGEALLTRQTYKNSIRDTGIKAEMSKIDFNPKNSFLFNIAGIGFVETMSNFSVLWTLSSASLILII